MNKQLEVVQKAINNAGHYSKPTAQAEAAWNAVIEELIKEAPGTSTKLFLRRKLQQMKQEHD